MELHAISYKCDIPLVIHENSKPPVLINKSSKQPYCHLWKHGQHLAWLAGTASDECKAFLATAAQEPPYAGGRFGGKVAGSVTSAQKSCGSFKTIARSAGLGVRKNNVHEENPRSGPTSCGSFKTIARSATKIVIVLYGITPLNGEGQWRRRRLDAQGETSMQWRVVRGNGWYEGDLQ